MKKERGQAVANAITCIRIFCAAGLIFCPAFSAWFYVIYLMGGISDVLDGMAARHFGKETVFGAQLDTIADAVFTAIVMIKLVRAVDFPLWIIIWAVCIAVIKCMNVIVGFVMQKRFLPEHTVLNKICGILLFVLPLFIGRCSRQWAVILTIPVCAAATAAAVQEGCFIRMGKEIR